MTANLNSADIATVAAALSDAVEWHEYRASLTCADCEEHPAELCPDHAAALDTADAYRALARRLGGERTATVTVLPVVVPRRVWPPDHARCRQTTNGMHTGDYADGGQCWACGQMPGPGGDGGAA